MPIYDYECTGCGHRFELRQSFDADPVSECPVCHGASRRRFHSVTVIYKGSGWYSTDYKNSASNNGSSPSTDGKTTEDKAPAEKPEPARSTEKAASTVSDKRD